MGRVEWAKGRPGKGRVGDAYDRRVTETFHTVPDSASDSLYLLISFILQSGFEGLLTPIEKAPPKSLMITYGHGSRE